MITKPIKHLSAAETRQKIGNRIREQRTLRGATLKTIAQHAGVSIGQISRYECGATPIDIGMVARLALALRCSVASLIVDFIDSKPASTLPTDVLEIAQIAGGIKSGGLRKVLKGLAAGLAKWERENDR